MKNINIGLTNLAISNKVRSSYFNTGLLEESKTLTNDFFSLVKGSPILQLEFKVFDNIENKTIENDSLATRYIDNNIKLFEVYTIEELNDERQKLEKFFDEGLVLTEENALLNPSKVELYEAIDVLINESLNTPDKVSVDDVHEAYEYILTHIKSPKTQLDESKCENVDADIIEIAVNKFNERYSGLNEDDKTLLSKLIESDDNTKQTIFEEYRSDCLNRLENIKADEIKNSEDWDKVTKTIQKIQEMKTTSITIDNDIVGLHELKAGLL